MKKELFEELLESVKQGAAIMNFFMGNSNFLSSSLNYNYTKWGMHLTALGSLCSILEYWEGYLRILREFEARFFTESACREFLFPLQ